MIVRILGEGQYELPDAALSGLEALDTKMGAAMEAGDEAGFAELLAELAEKVRSTGDKVGTDVLVTSDLTLPHEGSTIAEVQKLLSSEPENAKASEGA